MNPLLKVFASRRMTTVALMGFLSGLPLALTSSTPQAWLVDEKIDLGLVGIFTLVGLPYTFKFLWAPFMDMYLPPLFSGLGRRKAWVLLCQLLLALAIAATGYMNPASMLGALAVGTMMIAFLSASHDNVIDAYKIEILKKDELGPGAGVAYMGYRIAMLFSGAFALFLADHMPWHQVYLIMSATMAVGAVVTYFSPKPETLAPPRSLKEALADPFTEFFSRRGAIEVLAFMILYKLDVAMTLAMNTAFFLDLGFTKTDVAAVTKVFGMIAAVTGGIVAGALMTRISIYRALMWFGALQAVSSLSFTALAHVGKNYAAMVVAVFTENFCSGLGNTAFMAFIMSVTSKRFTTTQYALLASFMALARYVAGAPSGYLVKAVGWEGYFIATTLVGIPGLLLLALRFRRWVFPSA